MHRGRKITGLVLENDRYIDNSPEKEKLTAASKNVSTYQPVANTVLFLPLNLDF